LADLPELRPEHLLGRRIFSSSDARKASRTENPIVTFRIFVDEKHPLELSTDRLDFADDTVMTQAADEEIPPDRNAFYGWATMSVENASQNERVVRVTPREGNPYHADICLPTPSAQETEVRIQHARELASYARWRSRAD